MGTQEQLQKELSNCLHAALEIFSPEEGVFFGYDGNGSYVIAISSTSYPEAQSAKTIMFLDCLEDESAFIKRSFYSLAESIPPVDETTFYLFKEDTNNNLFKTVKALKSDEFREEVEQILENSKYDMNIITNALLEQFK